MDFAQELDNLIEDFLEWELDPDDGQWRTIVIKALEDKIAVLKAENND